jgi:hypothetical protein
VKDLHSGLEHPSVKRFHVIFKEQLLYFQQCITELKKRQGCAFKHTGNADKMVVYFGMHQNYIVDVQGVGEVKIRSTGYEKQHVMVMLCITADGHKLPPCVIFTHNMMPKNDMFPKRLYCICIKMDAFQRI